MIRSYILCAVFGASGSGKSTLLDIITQICPQATVHRKLTTRKIRPGESAQNAKDLVFVDEVDPRKCEVVYRKFGNDYGVRKDLLRQAFMKKEVHFIIMRDTQAIRKLKQSHPETRTIYIHTDPESVDRNLQKREGVDMQGRRSRIRDDFAEFVHNNTLFDHVVVNFWDIENATRQIENILASCLKSAARELL